MLCWVRTRLSVERPGTGVHRCLFVKVSIKDGTFWIVSHDSIAIQTEGIYFDYFLAPYCSIFLFKSHFRCFSIYLCFIFFLVLYVLGEDLMSA